MCVSDVWWHVMRRTCTNSFQVWIRAKPHEEIKNMQKWKMTATELSMREKSTKDESQSQIRQKNGKGQKNWQICWLVHQHRAVRPLIHGTMASLVPFGNISFGFLTGTFSEGPSNRDDVAPGGLTHTDDSSTCLSGVVRRSGIASHRPLLKHFT